MKHSKLVLAVLMLVVAAPCFAQGPEEFVGKWKSDPGTPTMTRELALEGKTIVMIELQPGRNGGPDLTIIRKYPTDGSEVTMDIGMWNGSKVTGKLEGKVLTCDTTMPSGTKFHDVWTLAADGKTYTNDMTISGAPMRPAGGASGSATSGGQSNSSGSGNGSGGGGQSAGNGQGTGAGQSGGSGAGSGMPRTIKFSFTRTE
jgi:hypothetical protein